MGTTGIWVEARDAAQHFTTHRRLPSPIFRSQNLNSAEVDSLLYINQKPISLKMTLQLFSPTLHPFLFTPFNLLSPFLCRRNWENKNETFCPTICPLTHSRKFLNYPDHPPRTMPLLLKFPKTDDSTLSFSLFSLYTLSAIPDSLLVFNTYFIE